jgi:hypothetical protein|tara:strand:- start:1804 stop:2448 length:645 start_codon:yes stop_codon:yes gene_type:complete
MSYTNTTLTQAIKDYTENDETTFTTNIPNFIKNAEERILKLVELDYFRKNVTGTLTNGNKFLAVPTDYLGSIAISIINSNEHDFLLFKDVNFVQQYAPNPNTTGIPKYYALFDINNFIISPTPNSNYSIELHYYYRPVSITASGDGTTWLGTNAPDALLYGSLYESYVFMKGDADILQMYTDRFNEAIIRLKNYGEGFENTDAYRTGLRRVQKT